MHIAFGLRVTKPLSLVFLLLVFVFICYSINWNSQDKPGLTNSDDEIKTGAKDTIFEHQQGKSLLLNSNLFVNKNVNVGVAPPVDILITFTNAEHNQILKTNFRMTVESLFRFTSTRINLFLLGDTQSEKIAKDILPRVPNSQKHNISYLVINSLTKQVHKEIAGMQKYFSEEPGAYYSDPLFLLSVVIHKVLPEMHRLILLDCDLKFNADIRELFNRFDLFTETNIIGIAREAQPTYRANFNVYINKNKGTRVGAPPPDGLTGLNSGVLLMDLDKMRKSDLYNSLLSAESVKKLTEKYMFKGKLGDQDFYSLISLEHEELFHVLPCNWNRQLCTWWKDHGYAENFDQYFNCEGHINIYHGNCNTPIPKQDWETEQ